MIRGSLIVLAILVGLVGMQLSQTTFVNVANLMQKVEAPK